MSPTTPPARAPRPRWHRTATALAAAGAVTLGGTLIAAPTASASFQASSDTDVVMVHANLRVGLTVERFQADVRKVIATDADVITYNEVAGRQDVILAPEGYDIYRNPKNRYTGATPVVWREDRWTAVDQGTFRVSNYRKIPPKKKTQLGHRYANWVTLQSLVDGRRISVVSAHVAPITRGMPDLLVPSVKRINKLVGKLAPAGPVMVGGDFNVHFKSGRYPRTLFDSSGLVPTYDTLGTYFPTGDHFGNTVDYIFNRGAGSLVASEHGSFELNSDHDGVAAGFSWLSDPVVDTQRVVSDPRGGREAQYRAVTALARAIGGTGPGAQVDLVSADLKLRKISRSLVAAASRGAEVGLTTRSSPLTSRERKLRKADSSTGRAVDVDRCRNECLTAWKQSKLSRSFLLVRDESGRATLRVDVNRTVGASMRQRRTQLVLHTGQVALREGERMLASLS